jgi:hypothetical protein
MINYKLNHNYTGQDIFFNGEKVGALFYGDLTQSPQDRTPVTMINVEKGTRYHKDIQTAKEWIKNILEGTR